MKDKKIYLGVGPAFLLLMTVSLSYAYFSTNVSGNDNAKDVLVTAGTLSLTYTDGPEIKVENIRPGKTITKEVSVKNTGTLDTNYNIIWQLLVNEITNDELVISATCQRLNASGTVEGTCNSILQAPISGTTIERKISIESGITHKYTFTILFKETNTNQNYNQGKKFSGVLGIEESKDSESPVAFSTDSWDTIVSAVKSGDTSVYKVGDTKEIDMGDYGTHTLRIANISTPDECKTEGFSQSACGFVLEFADIITTHNMNDIDINEDGWPASSMYTFVNNDVYNAIPDEVKNSIIDTVVVSGYGTFYNAGNFTSTDKLYLLSTAKVLAGTVLSISNNIKVLNEKPSILLLAGTITSCNAKCDTARNVTRQLDYYKNLGITVDNNYSGAIKKYETSNFDWWLRTPTKDASNYFTIMGGDYPSYGLASCGKGVSPAFRIG